MNELTDSYQPWSAAKKFFFRFFFVYILFFVFLDGFMSVIVHATPLVGAWDSLLNVVGSTVFGIEQLTVKPNGSGDTTYNYVQLFTIFCLTVLCVLAWTRIDREKHHHERLAYGLRVFIRHYLALILIIYGLAKVFKTQFPYPTYEMLARSYGDSSPMGLLWTFMGYSYPYNLFTGLGEVMGGALLLFRRTTLLGALIIIGVMSNVVVLNFSYDVPVKIYSTHLLLMTFFLVLPDLQRLRQFFIANQHVEPARMTELGLNKNLVKAGRILLSIVLVGMIGTNIYFFVKLPDMMAAGNRDAVLYGQYKVTEFEPEILSTRLKWTALVVQGSGVRVTTQDGSEQNITWNADPENGTLDVFAFSDSLRSSTMYYTHLSDSLLKMNGWFKGDSISMTLRPVTKEDYLLSSRRFNWINEYPFNR